MGILQQREQDGHAEMAHRIGNIIGHICRYATRLEYIFKDISISVTEVLEPKPTVKHRAAITEPERTVVETGRSDERTTKASGRVCFLTDSLFCEAMGGCVPSDG